MVSTVPFIAIENHGRTGTFGGGDLIALKNIHNARRRQCSSNAHKAKTKTFTILTPPFQK